jgi:hypothetical protein
MVGMPRAVASHPSVIPARATLICVKIQTHDSEPLIALQERSSAPLLLGQVGQASSSNPPPRAEGAVSSPGETTKKPQLVTDISVRAGSEGEITIDVATTKVVNFRVLRLGNPDRLVVDLEGAINHVPKKLIPVSSAIVRDVRVRQFQFEVVRVVADLSGDPVFDVQPFSGGVRIELKPPPKSASGRVAEAPAAKPETVISREEGKPPQQAVPTKEGADSSRVEMNSQQARNRNSQKSVPGASPAVKDEKVEKSQKENVETVPILDDVLRLLFGQGMPPPSPATSPVKPAAPPAVKKLEGPASASDILVRRGPAGAIIIDLIMTKPLPFRAFRIGDPDRFVVDVHGVRNQLPGDLIPVTSRLVKQVRVGEPQEENPELLRVVVDLSGNPLCSARPFGRGVRIEVKPRPAAASEGPGAAPTGKTP